MIPLREVVKALQARKALGQNFLIDPHILERIVATAAPLRGCTVIEVGPGPGGLSREIVKHPCAEVFLIEKDARCFPYLEPLKDQGETPVTLINEDATEFPVTTLGKKPRKIISNLPYNVSVPLLLQWLRNIDAFESLTLMFQKEVAERLVASPSTPAYGRLSVMSQAYTQVRKVFDLPPGAFFPAPKVTSTLVHFTPLASREIISRDALELLTKTAFSQRRKMLRSTLKGLVPLSTLEDLNISPLRRAETLSIQEFVSLANTLSYGCFP